MLVLDKREAGLVVVVLEERVMVVVVASLLDEMVTFIEAVVEDADAEAVGLFVVVIVVKVKDTFLSLSKSTKLVSSPFPLALVVPWPPSILVADGQSLCTGVEEEDHSEDAAEELRLSFSLSELFAAVTTFFASITLVLVFVLVLVLNELPCTRTVTRLSNSIN